MEHLQFSRTQRNAGGISVLDTILASHSKTYLHNHDFYEIFLVTQGEVIHFCNGGQAQLATGCLCLVQPQDAHCFSLARGCKRAVFVNIAFSGEDMARANAGLPLAQSLTRLHPTVTGYIQHEAKLLQALGAACPQARAQLLLSTLLCKLGETQEAQDIPQWLAVAINTLRQDDALLAEGLPALLRAANRSQEHVNRCVKQHCGCTPTALVNTMRLARARDMLLQTDAPVLHICTEAGFDSVSYFNRLFKAAYGLTPREYRRQGHGILAQK